MMVMEEEEIQDDPEVIHTVIHVTQTRSQAMSAPEAEEDVALRDRRMARETDVSRRVKVMLVMIRTAAWVRRQEMKSGSRR